MSNSAGNVINPFALIEKYGAKALRYYLLSDIATGSDADFREGSLVAGYNHALANTLGNLANRTLNMIHRFRYGTIKSIGLTALPESEVRSHLQAWSDDELKAGQTFYRNKLADFRPSNALSAPLARALASNALVEISAAWNLAKNQQREKKVRDRGDASPRHPILACYPESAGPAVAPYLLRALFKCDGLTAQLSQDFASEMERACNQNWIWFSAG